MHTFLSLYIICFILTPKSLVSIMDIDGPISENNIIEGLNINLLKYCYVWFFLQYFRLTRKVAIHFYIAIFVTLALLLTFILFQVLCFLCVSVSLKEGSLLILNPLTSIQGVSKVAVFYYWVEKQAALMNLYKKDFLPSLKLETQYKVQNIYRYYAKKANILMSFGICANFFCVTFWNFLPMFRSNVVEDLLGMKLKAEGESNKILGGWYPVRYDLSPWYEIIYVFEFLACSWCGYIVTWYEVLLISVVMMLGAHFKALSCCIAENISRNQRSLVVQGDTNDNTISGHEQLLSYIKDHQMLLIVGDELKKFYNFLITMQLGSGLLVMTISVFHFYYLVRSTWFSPIASDPYPSSTSLLAQCWGMVSLFSWPMDHANIALTIKFLVYLSYQIIEIILYCHVGQFLQTTSEDVVSSAYSTDWYQRDNQFRNSCQMMMVRAKTPLTLIAVRLYPVNNVTLLSMLQFTVSTAALLSRLSE